MKTKTQKDVSSKKDSNNTEGNNAVLSVCLEIGLSQTTSTRESKDPLKRETARRISKLYGWNKSSVKDMLGDCKQI